MSRPLALLVVLGAAGAWAKPPGPGVLCQTYPGSPLCVGQQPACTLCHTAAPQRNVFGAAIEAKLAPGAARPLSDGDFAMALPAALHAVEGDDSDGDGVSNLVELQKGTQPGDPKSYPHDVPCAGGANPAYDVCKYDLRWVFKKLELDFCGISPTYAVMKAFLAMTPDQQRATLDTELDRCVGTEFWVGKNGQLWRLAHPKIRPVGSLKKGEDQGQIPLADYYDDYNLFVWAHTGDRDARELLTAKYFVDRSVSAQNVTTYSKVLVKGSQAMDAPHRAGNMTTAWTLVDFVMFTALPRNAAAQMYRAYLGLDIAKQEGLYSVAGEPKDYDGKGVTKQQCAACHATLDPLSYPYRNYMGIAGGLTGSYVNNRIETYFTNGAPPTITQIPESGAVFNQPVANLVEWAQVASNSDAFARAVVTDYWKFLMGHPPTPEEQAEFTTVWQAFKTTHNYRVQPMLHDLIRTEAYGAP